MLRHLHLVLFDIFFTLYDLVEEILELIIVQETPSENPCLHEINSLKEYLEGDELLHAHTWVVFADFLTQFLDLQAELFDVGSHDVAEFGAE